MSAHLAACLSLQPTPRHARGADAAGAWQGHQGARGAIARGGCGAGCTTSCGTAGPDPPYLDGKPPDGAHRTVHRGGVRCRPGGGPDRHRHGDGHTWTAAGGCLKSVQNVRFVRRFCTEMTRSAKRCVQNPKSGRIRPVSPAFAPPRSRGCSSALAPPKLAPIIQLEINKMKLISSGTSPFVRKVLVLLHETGQLDDIEIVTAATTPYDTAPEVASANPIGKIPALIRAEGPAIYDSRVICRYLDDRAQAGLYPDGRRWETLTLEATADGIMEAAVLMVYEHKMRPGEAFVEAWVDAQWTKIERAVAALNARWMSHLRGPLDMGQIAMGCALGYLDFRHDARGWRKGNDALDDWYAVFSQRESMKLTAPAYVV